MTLKQDILGSMSEHILKTAVMNLKVQTENEK